MSCDGRAGHYCAAGVIDNPAIEHRQRLWICGEVVRHVLLQYQLFEELKIDPRQTAPINLHLGLYNRAAHFVHADDAPLSEFIDQGSFAATGTASDDKEAVALDDLRMLV
jgi:hypothetical protein